MTYYVNLISVPAGTWTRIFQGPSFHLLGQQILQFFQPLVGGDGRNFNLNFTVDRYSAVIPFYYSQSDTATATPGFTGDPFDRAYFLPAVSSSPWTEIWVLTNKNCQAHIVA